MSELAGQDAPVDLVELHQLDEVGEACLPIIHSEVKSPLFLALQRNRGQVSGPCYMGSAHCLCWPEVVPTWLGSFLGLPLAYEGLQDVRSFPPPGLLPCLQHRPLLGQAGTGAAANFPWSVVCPASYNIPCWDWLEVPPELIPLPLCLQVRASVERGKGHSLAG